MPFDLHPEYPPEGLPMAQLEAKYGAGLADRRKAMFEQAGLPHAEPIQKIPNSRGALMLGELARDRGVLDQLHPRLFDAYWAQGRDIGDHAVLVELGTSVGLDEAEIIEVVQDQRYLDRVEAQTRAVIEMGAGGVPAWVIDRKLLVPGAQPHEVFERAMEQLGHTAVDGAE